MAPIIAVVEARRVAHVVGVGAAIAMIGQGIPAIPSQPARVDVRCAHVDVNLEGDNRDHDVTIVLRQPRELGGSWQPSAAPILLSSAIDPVLPSTSATRSRLAPQLVMELALKPSLGRPTTFMKSVDDDPGPLTAIVGPLPPPPAV